MSDLERLCEKQGVKVDARYGVSIPWDQLDEWQRRANPWTVTIRYRGRRMTVPFFMGEALSHEPTAADVLACLVRDAASFENARDFEDWCADYGYDADSRKAEKVWRTVEKQAPRVRRLLGEDFETFAAAEH